MSRLGHNESLDDLGTQRIGLAHHGGERHSGVLDETILDFGRPDAVPRRRMTSSLWLMNWM
jgi:hypothetical protein